LRSLCKSHNILVGNLIKKKYIPCLYFVPGSGTVTFLSKDFGIGNNVREAGFNSEIVRKSKNKIK